LVDENHGLIGIINEVTEMPQQEMAVLNYREKEILIPLHATLIEAIDTTNQKITVRLPEGLLDL